MLFHVEGMVAAPGRRIWRAKALAQEEAAPSGRRGPFAYGVFPLDQRVTLSHVPRSFRGVNYVKSLQHHRSQAD